VPPLMAQILGTSIAAHLDAYAVESAAA
jgi:hypothetical protein